MKNSSLTKTQVAETWAMRWIKPAVLMVLTTLTFVYGVGVGHYHWPPFWQIQGAKNTLTQLLPEPVVEYRGEAELLVYAFTDPVAEADLYYPPITDLAGIRRANDRIFMLSQGFETAFEDLQVLEAEQLNRPQGAVLSPPFVNRRRADANSRHISGTPMPASTRLTASMIWLSLNFDLFI
jgi:hypothetical protein